MSRLRNGEKFKVFTFLNKWTASENAAGDSSNQPKINLLEIFVALGAGNHMSFCAYTCTYHWIVFPPLPLLVYVFSRAYHWFVFFCTYHWFMCFPALTTRLCFPALTTGLCFPALTTGLCFPALTTGLCFPALTTDDERFLSNVVVIC